MEYARDLQPVQVMSVVYSQADVGRSAVSSAVLEHLEPRMRVVVFAFLDQLEGGYDEGGGHPPFTIWDQAEKLKVSGYPRVTGIQQLLQMPPLQNLDDESIHVVTRADGRKTYGVGCEAVTGCRDIEVVVSAADIDVTFAHDPASPQVFSQANVFVGARVSLVAPGLCDEAARALLDRVRLSGPSEVAIAPLVGLT